MILYAEFEGEICEVMNYSKMGSKVKLKSPSEGYISVEKRLIKLVGFRNGKKDTGELKILEDIRSSYKFPPV